MASKKCPSCNSIVIGMKMNCKLCDSKFCLSCLMPEIHKCIKLNEFKESCKLKLKEDLLRNKCVKTKLEKI